MKATKTSSFSPFRAAFTLVELAVVLVIIGLIVGSILVGRDLVRAAELRSVVSDVESFQSAINTFRIKYGGLPGDIADATSLWGTDSSCPSTAYNTVPKTATCNGNADGRIANSDASANLTNREESFRAWQQLANAELIAGKYTGARGFLASMQTVIGLNVPASKMANGGYTITFYNNITGGDANAFAINTEHVIWFGASTNSGSTLLPLLTAAEAFSIDQKTDDGLPGSGGVLDRPNGNTFTPNCTTTTNATTSAYSLSSSGIACGLTFRLKGF